MKLASRCKIKIPHLLLLLNFIYFENILAVPSTDDLIYVASPELETIAEFENDTFSQPFIFEYENFILDYIVACRIGSNVTFATRNPITGRLQSVDEDRYDVVGGDIGAEGEFQISLRGNINEQDGNCLVCGFATPGFVMETSCIRLRITRKPIYYIEQRPDNAVTGDEVEIYCIVSGHPFPNVKFTPPFYLPVETRLLSLPNETLRVVQYVSTINYIDVSWKDEEVKCQVFTDETIYREKVMKVFVKRYNESIVFDDQTVSTVAVVCAILGAFLMASMMLGVVMYMKRKNKREAYYCMKINGCGDEGGDRAPLNKNNQKLSENKPVEVVTNYKYPKDGACYPTTYNHQINYKSPPSGNTKNKCPPQSLCPNQPNLPPPPKIHYFPQQIINVTQKHSHHEPKNSDKKGVQNNHTNGTSQCKTPTISHSPPPQSPIVGKKPKKEPRQREISCKINDQKQKQPKNSANKTKKHKTKTMNVSSSAFV